MNCIRVLIVDEHPLLRKGVSKLLENEPDMAVVGEAGNGREAVLQYRYLKPDIALMDLQMPGLSGIETLTAIRSEFPQAAVIALTSFAGDAHVSRALNAGARAYLLKNTLPKELVDCIRSVHAGRKTLSPEVVIEVAQYAAEAKPTAGETAVLRLLAQGGSNKQIGRRLGIAEDTVKNRISSILTKLNAIDRTHAVVIAIRRGIIDL